MKLALDILFDIFETLCGGPLLSKHIPCRLTNDVAGVLALEAHREYLQDVVSATTSWPG